MRVLSTPRPQKKSAPLIDYLLPLNLSPRSEVLRVDEFLPFRGAVAK